MCLVWKVSIGGSQTTVSVLRLSYSRKHKLAVKYLSAAQDYRRKKCFFHKAEILMIPLLTTEEQVSLASG